MITALALDDEPLALEIIKAFCGRTDFLELKYSTTSPADAMTYLKENSVDLLFLDINMPGISGIDFFKSAGGNSLVIFTTAYSEYAVEGFNISATDYLLKPFKFTRFMQAVEKAREQINYLNIVDPASQYLYIRADYSTQKILIDDIIYIEGMDNYIKLHFTGKKPILARMSMKGIVEKLPPNDFVRVHRSYIVSVKKITSAKNKAVYIGATEIPIGINYAEKVLPLFNL